jgi:hypothetical protein
MTPFVEAARQLVRGLVWENSPLPYVSHAGRRLEWRHHGLGMLQAELSETLRIHIWHPRLVSDGMVWPRCVHDHRFDIVSAVVYGAVLDVLPDVRKDKGSAAVSGGWQKAKVYEIEHAKNQDRMVLEGGGTAATSAQLLGDVILTRFYSSTSHGAGSEYSIPRRTFHTTEVTALAITVIQRANFDDKLARVLCAPGSDVTAVSGIVRDESLEHKILVNWVLREAASAIARLDSAS